MSIDNLLIHPMKKRPGMIITIDRETVALKTYDDLMDELADFYRKRDLVLIPEKFKGKERTSARIFKEAKVNVKYEQDDIKVEQSGGEYYGHINIEYITNKTPIPPSIEEDYPTRWGTKTEELFLVYFDVMKKRENKKRTEERDEFLGYFQK
ncbi:MAG: hypothetical protein KJ583_00070 [Nanoarchaeota archaeon]|nr:hypothetical protein [Nanoarchaeota archaeon]MBU1270366.1 hypothetical protein [Nanoarchaeota archaeon]MBU1603683.1 hypothetical protein [Nanoarchaeota archaeon]MBU2443363.1 hypothetical protein [Nanoarchaeota archaeon]